MADLGFKEDATAAKELGFVEDEGAARELAGGGRKSKYPDPKSFSAPDASDTGIIKTTRVPGTAINLVEKPEALTPELQASRNDDEQAAIRKSVTDLATSGGVGGGLKTALASKLAKPAATTSIGINALAKSAAKPLAERISDALGKTVESSILARGIQLLAPSAIEVGKKAVGAGVNATRAIVPTAAGAATGELGPSTMPEGTIGPQSGLSNAVDRLRASAANNPRAADLLARMQASKNTPTGTVTQGTGVA